MSTFVERLGKLGFLTTGIPNLLYTTSVVAKQPRCSVENDRINTNNTSGSSTRVLEYVFRGNVVDEFAKYTIEFILSPLKKNIKY